MYKKIILSLLSASFLCLNFTYAQIYTSNEETFNNEVNIIKRILNKYYDSKGILLTSSPKTDEQIVEELDASFIVHGPGTEIQTRFDSLKIVVPQGFYFYDLGTAAYILEHLSGPSIVNKNKNYLIGILSNNKNILTNKVGNNVTFYLYYHNDFGYVSFEGKEKLDNGVVALQIEDNSGEKRWVVKPSLVRDMYFLSYFLRNEKGELSDKILTTANKFNAYGYVEAEALTTKTDKIQEYLNLIYNAIRFRTDMYHEKFNPEIHKNSGINIADFAAKDFIKNNLEPEKTSEFIIKYWYIFILSVLVITLLFFRKTLRNLVQGKNRKN